MTSTAKYKTSAPNKPKSCWDLFCSFTLMAMQAFGGSTAIAQQFLVDQKKWLTQSEFIDLLTVSQVLPGPNIMILTIMVGDTGRLEALIKKLRTIKGVKQVSRN